MTSTSMSIEVVYVVRHLNVYPDIRASLDRMVTDAVIGTSKLFEVRPGEAPTQQDESWQKIIDHVRENRSEIVVLHHFHSPGLTDPRDRIRELQALPHRPAVGLTNGDSMYNGFFRATPPRMFVQAAEAADVVFSTSMGSLADLLTRQTGCRVALLPWGLCPVRFGSPALPVPESRRDFKVIVIGSNNGNRNPLRPYHWYNRQRRRLIRDLERRFGDKFAVFGHGWEGVRSWHGPIPFEHQHQVCRRAEVVVGGVPFSRQRYYTSDRVFIQIASGVPFVDLAIEGTETILRPGEHWYLADRLGDIADLCDNLLAQPSADQMEKARLAAEFVRQNHSTERRCRLVVRTLLDVRKSLVAGRTPTAPLLDFFLPSVNSQSESSLAIRGWERGKTSDPRLTR